LIRYAMSLPLTSPGTPAVVGEVLDEFRRTHARNAWFWLRADDEGWRVGAATAPPPGQAPSPDAVPVDGGPDFVGCLQVEEGGPDGEVRFLASVLERLLQHEAEARFFGRELAERYEEITLLYSISEILGSVISLEAAAGTILSEVAGTLAVQRAALWLHNEEAGQLELIAAVGVPGQRGPIAVSDASSVTATVFHERRALILEPQDEFPRGGRAPELVSRGSFLSVPVSYTPPEGDSRTIGVINLIGRDGGESFSAGDQKLIAAIASQIGAAVENGRLVAETLRQDRMVREMELAHDLQLKLLPSVEQFAGFAQVAARCAPAESVGGDFYHLFRLPGGRIGVMIGDVSSHGFSAALIMALAMSAVAIHASDDDSPGEVLRRAHRALIGELETTEMYLTLFYGVIDPMGGRITYANAGHSHAFRVQPGGETTRLAATNPPFGIVDLDTYGEETAPWAAGEDLLFLFTDGLSDSLGLGEVEGEQRLLHAVAEQSHAPVDHLLRRIFSLQGRATNVPADDRTAVLVRI
jgi:sigma-B regulation protein RsbU (phosphoserine phosphatase)